MASLLRKKTKKPRKIEIDDATATESLNAVMPPTFRVWHDSWNSRWRLFQGRRLIRSYSFNLYGVGGASKMALGYATQLRDALHPTEPWVLEIA